MTTLSTIRPRLTSICCATLALAAGQALAQSTVVSGGLLHSATGSATISPSPTGQGVFVHSTNPNDGVSIQFDNAWGGGVAFDSSSLFAADGMLRSVECAFAPWEDPCAGLPENCGVTAVYRSNGDGSMNLNVESPTYTGGWTVTTFDPSGVPVTGPLNPGGVTVDQVNCGPGKIQVSYSVWQNVWNPVYQMYIPTLVTYTLCVGVTTPNWDLDPGFSDARVIMLTPVGVLPDDVAAGMSRCQVTSEGIPELHVCDARMGVRPPTNPDLQLNPALATAGPGSVLTSSCQADTLCCEDCDDRDDSSLRISGTPGSGPRVLSVASRSWLGVSSTGMSEEAGMSFSQACDDCTNQTTTTYLRDDNGLSISFDVTSMDASQSSHALSFDFGELGTTNLVLRAYSIDGTEVTPPGGTPIVGRQVFNTTNNPCPPGTIPTWTWWYKPGHGWLLSFSCWVNTNMVLPGGTTLTGVHHISVSTADALMQLGSLDQADVVSQCDAIVRSFGPDPITGSGPACDSIDFNNDTSTFDPQDIDAFLSVYSEGPCIPDTALCNDIDFNNDSSVYDPCDIDSFLLQFSEGPCTPCGI